MSDSGQSGGSGEAPCATQAEAAEARPLRADAERNRRSLLDAAEALFTERGLDVSVGEIAQRAGVGRGTLFRNFPSKEHLIAAIVVERIGDATAVGRELLGAEDPGAALFEFFEHIVGRQQTDRALFEAVGDAFLSKPDVLAAYTTMMGVLDQLLGRAQAAGAVRDDVGALDMLMMFKGVCQAATAFAHLSPGVAERQLDLVRAALSARPGTTPLRGHRPTFDDLAQVFPHAPVDADDRAAG